MSKNTYTHMHTYKHTYVHIHAHIHSPIQKLQGRVGVSRPRKAANEKAANERER